MKQLYSLIIAFLLFLPRIVSAQFSIPPVVDGTIALGEYGIHANGFNMMQNGAQSWFMTWDDVNLYVAVATANISEAAVLYLDKNPMLPSNGGSNADGSLFGFAYDNTNFDALQFRGDVVLYFKNGYREARLADGAGGWSPSMSAIGSMATGPGDVREFAIPWSVIGGRPASFSHFSYVTSPSGFVYGQIPPENGAGFIGINALYDRYFTVSTTDSGNATAPYSRTSFVFNRTTDAVMAPPHNVFDFTMNSAGRTLDLPGGLQAMGSCVVANGTVRFDSVGPGESMASLVVESNILISLGTMQLGTSPLTIKGNLSVSSPERFSAQQTMVVLAGLRQKLTGSINFGSLTKTSTFPDSLMFEAGSTITVNGHLSLAGSPGQFLALRSSVPATQWNLNALGTSTLDFLDVMDCNASGGSHLVATTSVNSGNNTNWSFGVVATPFLVVKPLSVNFGDVQMGQSAFDTVIVLNAGLAPLSLLPSMIDSGSHPAFSIVGFPSTFVLAPGESTMMALSFNPTTPTGVVVNGSLTIKSNGGNASVALSGRGVGNTPSAVTIHEPVGGETFASGDRIPIRFAVIDPEGLAEFKVTLSTDGGATFPLMIAHGLVTSDDSLVKTVIWNIPDNLETTQGQIKVSARDLFGNEASAVTADFSVLAPVTPGPMISVIVQFDPPPVNQILPPQNVTVKASELSGGTAPGINSKGIVIGSISGNAVVGYNVYRVPKPPEGDPIPTAEEIVGDSSNLVGTVPADSLTFREVLFQSRGDRFVYSLTALFDNGSESDGSEPAITEYSGAETSTAHGWFGPMDVTNSSWYTFPSVDAATLSISHIVPAGSPQGNRSLKFKVRNRGTNYASFRKFFGGIARPSPLAGVELGIRKVGGTPLLQCYVDYRQNGVTYSSSNTPHIADEDWHVYNLTFGPIPGPAIADTIVFGFGGYGDSCSIYVDYIAFVDDNGNVFEPMGDELNVTEFISIPPESMSVKNSLTGKLLKPVKRGKGLYPNWSNLVAETVVQGGFQPGATESDSAGGMRIGQSYMVRTSSDPLNPKWKPVKESAAMYAWARLTKWDFKKNQGKSANALQKTLENKGLTHTGAARGFDSTGVPGQVDPKRKKLKGELKKLDPKKTPNELFAELAAFKFSIAASQLSKTPNGFGELVFDAGDSPFDEMSLVEISRLADSLMTHWQSVPQEMFDSLHSTLYNINRAFAGPMDTISFEEGGILVVAGAVQLSSVSFIKQLSTPPRTLKPTSVEDESEEEPEFDEHEWENDEVPMVGRLYQNYPNPFNPATRLGFRLREPSFVTITVFDLLGRQIGTLAHNEEFEEGYQTMEFIADGLASGVYFYRMDVETVESGDRLVETKKMLLIR